MVCAGHHPLDIQNKALYYPAGQYHLAPLAGRETLCMLCFPQVFVGSYFN